jgi:hypothetical protein
MNKRVTQEDIILSSKLKALRVSKGLTMNEVAVILGLVIVSKYSAAAAVVNDSVVIKVKDSTGTYVPLFGGDISDIDIVVATGEPAITQNVTVTALGALSKLPKVLTEGVLAKDFDGDQVYEILSGVLFDQWNEVPAAETWAAYNPTTTLANAENSGLGEIDRPGDYELTARSASTTDVYSLVSALATSGLGYIYENALGQISYADDNTALVVGELGGIAKTQGCKQRQVNIGVCCARFKTCTAT